MHYIYRILFTAIGLLMLSKPVLADGHAWELVNDASKVSYGSIKKNMVGEVNHFTQLSGHISGSGQVEVAIDLSSVETFIGIRNERMANIVFGGGAASAILSAQLDLSVIDAMKVGETSSMDVSGKLSFMGKMLDIDVTMIVAKLSNSRFMAVTDEMLMVRTSDLGAEAAIDKLMALAKLPSITRVVPVSLRFTFDKTSSAKSTQSAAPAKASSAASLAAGKKLYRQCMACHQATSANNGVGPHLVGILGRDAGSVAGFRYSGAMTSSNLVWTEENLKRFIAKPNAVVAGTSMLYPGMSNAADLESLVVYLKSL